MASSVRQPVAKTHWTPDTVRRAVSALSTKVVPTTAPSAVSPSEDEDLARELMRTLRYAAEMQPGDLIATLGQLAPPSTSSRWDDTFVLLLTTKDSRTVIAQLTERHRDPGAHLIALLDEVAPPGVWWDDPDEFDDDDPSLVYRRAYHLLFEIGTQASLRWVLSRLDLFNYEPEGSYEKEIGKNRASIQEVALELWPALTWDKRGDIVLLFYVYKLLDHRFVELLLSVDNDTLPVRDRAEYLAALGNTYDPRMLPRIQNLFERVLDEVSQPMTASERRVVEVAMSQYDTLSTPLPIAIRERVEALGVPMNWRLRGLPAPTMDDFR